MQRMSKAKAPQDSFVDGYLAALLAQASHLISGEFHRVVTQKGLTVSEWRVLATLASTAEPMSIGALARLTVLKQPTLTRVLDRMENRAQVKRIPHETDRRITLIAIAPAGQRFVAELIDLAAEHERRVLEPLGLARSDELKKTLRQMIELHDPLVEDGGAFEDEPE